MARKEVDDPFGAGDGGRIHTELGQGSQLLPPFTLSVEDFTPFCAVELADFSAKSQQEALKDERQGRVESC